MSNFSSVARKSAVIVTAALCIQLTFGSILIPTNSRVPHGLQRSGLLKLSANDLGTHFGLAAHRGRNSLRKEGQHVQRMVLRGGGEEKEESEEEKKPEQSERMKAAIAKMEEMRAKDEAEKAIKHEKEREIMRKAEEAAKKIPPGYTVDGQKGTWLPEEEKRNRTATDQFQDPIYGSGWATIENRPIAVPKDFTMSNMSRTELLSRDELGWRLDDGSVAPQYGNAVGHMGFGTRSVGFDPIAAGQLYTNASYDPDGEWRAEDEAFVNKIKEERTCFGKDWYKYLPEDQEDYEKEQAMEDGETLMHYDWGLLDAAFEGDNIKLRAWMAKGANADAMDERVEDLEHRGAHGSYYAMHYAAMGGHRRTLEWLRAYGALHSPRNAMQETPLHLAAGGSSTDCVDTLLKMGADPNAEDCCGWTPLFKAAFYEAENATLEALVAGGADINHLDDNNRTVIDIVSAHNQTEQIELLERLGSLPAHVPGSYRGSAAERIGVIKNGSYVTLTPDFCAVFDLPTKQEAVDKGAVPLPHLFEREAPFYTFLDTLDINARERSKIQQRFSDGHDGPLQPGMVCRVVQVHWAKKSDGVNFVSNPYCIEISFGDDPVMLKRWGLPRQDSDSDEEEEEKEKEKEEGEKEVEWEEGSADNIRWWYSESALRLATKEEAEAAKRGKGVDMMSDEVVR